MTKLIVCCDGTWNDDADRTHIFRLAQAAERLNDESIKVFYDKGVGTDFGAILRGGAVGKGLSKNIRQAYGWLVQNWQPGDEIFAFGFSRGAYTVRSTGGFLNFAGLLHPEDTGPIAENGDNDLIEQAYEAYRMQRREPGQARTFLESPAHGRARRPKIRFLGVFDTVGALGVPVNWVQQILNRIDRFNVEFHDTTLSAEIDVACHALAIDERRGPFKPTYWTGRPANGQVVKQVWFAGVHSDVGGGYAEKDLAGLPLAWMLTEAKRAGLDLWPGFADDPIAQDAAGEIHDSMDPGYLAIHDLAPSIDPHDRPVGPQQRNGLEIPGEMLHQSVKDRIDGEAAGRLAAGVHDPYRPKALVDATGNWRAEVRDLPVIDHRTP